MTTRWMRALGLLVGLGCAPLAACEDKGGGPPAVVPGFASDGVMTWGGPSAPHQLVGAAPSEQPIALSSGRYHFAGTIGGTR